MVVRYLKFGICGFSVEICKVLALSKFIMVYGYKLLQLYEVNESLRYHVYWYNYQCSLCQNYWQK